MPHELDPQQDQGSLPQPHHHYCGNLFGCGEEKGTGVLREDIKDAAFTKRAADRLLHMDEMNQEQIDGYLTARGLSRRPLFRASGFIGALAGIGPWFTKLTNMKLAHAADALVCAAATGPAAAQKDDQGRVHVVESTDKTHLGVYDTTLDPILKVDSGDTISYVNTWSHFLNQMQPGVPVETLAKIRVSNPGRGPHSIIGPIYVNGAERQCLRLKPAALHFSCLGKEYTARPFPIFWNSGSAVTSQALRSMANSAANASAQPRPCFCFSAPAREARSRSTAITTMGISSRLASASRAFASPR